MSTVMTPAELAKLADDWNAARTARLALQKQVDSLQEQETGLKSQLIHELVNGGTQAIGGNSGTATLKRSNEPNVNDWDKLWEHIRTTGEFELLYKRANSAAIKERWENHVELPGVQAIEILNISWSKRK